MIGRPTFEAMIEKNPARPGKPPDMQFDVKKNGGNVGGNQQVAQTVVDVFRFLEIAAQLLVGGDQLLVSGARFFFRQGSFVVDPYPGYYSYSHNDVTGKCRKI